MPTGLGTFGVVYFIGSPESGLIKIGFSTDFAGRLGQIQAHSPVALEVLGSIGGCTVSDETRLHRLFASERVRNEWFRDIPEIRAIAESGRTPWHFGDPPIVLAVMPKPARYFDVPRKRLRSLERIRDLVLEGVNLYQLSFACQNSEERMLEELHAACCMGVFEGFDRELLALERRGFVKLAKVRAAAA